MSFLLEREPLYSQGGKFTFTAPDGREFEGKVFLDGVSVAPDERTEIDLNALPKFEMPDREKLSASFEGDIDMEAFRKAFPQLLFVEELWDRLHGKK
jgi:hypothetical protein